MLSIIVVIVVVVIVDIGVMMMTIIASASQRAIGCFVAPTHHLSVYLSTLVNIKIDLLTAEFFLLRISPQSVSS